MFITKLISCKHNRQIMYGEAPYIICLLCLQLISLVINMYCLHHTLFFYCVYSFNQFSNKHGLSSPYIIFLLCRQSMFITKLISCKHNRQIMNGEDNPCLLLNWFVFTANQFSNKHGLSSPYIICLLCLQLISLVINMDCLHTNNVWWRQSMFITKLIKAVNTTDK
jgi:hypothetical protein